MDRVRTKTRRTEGCGVDDRNSDVRGWEVWGEGYEVTEGLWYRPRVDYEWVSVGVVRSS